MQQNVLPIAIVVGSGFDERQFTEAQRYLLNAEVPTQVISPDGGLIQGWHQDTWGHHFMADDSLSDVLSADFQGLLLVGGARSVVSLQNKPHAKRFVRAFVQAAKPVAAIGEATVLLAVAEVAAGRRITTPEASRPAIERAGAIVSDAPTTTDGMLISADNDAEMTTILDAFGTLLNADDELEAAA